MPLPCIFVVHAWSWATSDNLILLEIETAEKLRGKKPTESLCCGLSKSCALKQLYQQLFSFVAADKHGPAHTAGCAPLFMQTASCFQALEKMELLPCPAFSWRLQEETFTSLCVEGRLREMDSPVFPRGQESVRLRLPVTTPVLRPSFPGRPPVRSGGFLQPPSHVFSEVKPASSSLSLCFGLGLWVWSLLSLPC